MLQLVPMSAPSAADKKRDKFKGSFAKGLHHKIFNVFSVVRTSAKNDRF